MSIPFNLEIFPFLAYEERKAIIEQLGDFKRFKTTCNTVWRRKGQAAAATEEEIAAEET